MKDMIFGLLWAASSLAWARHSWRTGYLAGHKAGRDYVREHVATYYGLLLHEHEEEDEADG